jgi:hypothetical protein
MAGLWIPALAGMGCLYGAYLRPLFLALTGELSGE